MNVADFLQNFLYPPRAVSDVKGYGETLSERFPRLSAAEVSAWTSRTDRPAVIMFIALITGIGAGAAAYLLKLGIAGLSLGVTSFFDPKSFNWWFILLPVIGLVTVGIFQRYIIRRKLYHGEDRLRHDFMMHRPYLPSSLTYNPLIACIITLGFGGSAGSEGPIAYSGAAIGSNVGGWMGMSPRTVRFMTAIGAGAGIAGIFKAPVGGMLFTIEVLGIELTTMAVAALVVACVASAMTTYCLSGFTPDIAFANESPINLDHWPLILLFGVFCGLYSAYYSGSMKLAGRWLGKLKNPWVKNIVAGLSIGIMLFLFPSLYGEGYGIVGALLNGSWQHIVEGGIMTSVSNLPLMLLLGALGLMLLKCFATAATNDGGGVTGNFAPTIMIGSVTGFFYAFLITHWLGIPLQISDYVFMGMAGILSGAIGAPLMAMFLVTEMATMGYGQFLPVAIVATISYLTVCLVRFIGLKMSQGFRHDGCKDPRLTDSQE